MKHDLKLWYPKNNCNCTNIGFKKKKQLFNTFPISVNLKSYNKIRANSHYIQSLKSTVLLYVELYIITII